jgi:hypothetical protein
VSDLTDKAQGAIDAYRVQLERLDGGVRTFTDGTDTTALDRKELVERIAQMEQVIIDAKMLGAA